MSSEKKKKIAILGCGNLGQAMAAHLSSNDYSVHLFNRTAKKLEPIINAGNQIKYFGHVGEGTATLDVVDGDIKNVMQDDCKWLMLCCPANGVRTLMELALPYIQPDHHIVVHPGQLFGALEVRQMCMEFDEKNLSNVTISELESSLITCRAVEIGNVEMFAIKDKLGFSTMPASRNQECLDFFCPLYAKVLAPRPSVLHTELGDLNLIVHPIVTMLNCGQIDRGFQFLFYKEGVSRHIGRMIERADSERIAIARALGLELLSLKDWVLQEYGPQGAHGDTAEEVITSNHAYDTLLAPTKLYTRYIFEDVPYGLMGMTELAQQLNVATPTLDCMLQLASLMFDNHVDEWKQEHRTLKSLKLDHLSPEQLVEYCLTGQQQIT